MLHNETVIVNSDGRTEIVENIMPEIEPDMLEYSGLYGCQLEDAP